MRLTIERLRTLVLLCGGLLVVALVAFLVVGRWKGRLSLRDLPKRLGADIERQQKQVVYTRSSHGHMLFKLRAAKVLQLKEGGRALLDDVEIELYGKDGATADRIRGGEFEWDDQAKTATAAGPVEILIMRPMATAAVAEGMHGAKPAKPLAKPLGNAAQSVSSGEINVKTSGLTFNQQTGAATTAQRVEFSTVQGTGSSEGASFNSDNGQLVLDRAVELNLRRGSETVQIHAQHAEFDRDQLICNLSAAAADGRGGRATAGQAQIEFRQDGSASRLDAREGFALATGRGGRIAAPTGWLEFNEQNQPQQGRLEGGVSMESEGAGRQTSGSAATADLQFSKEGELRHAHLSGGGERGVAMHSEQNGPGASLAARDWRSPVADVEFRTEAKGRTEIEQVHGTGGVVITGQTQRGSGPALPSRMAADDVTGTFAAGQQLQELKGAGRASLEQTTATGARQKTSGDRIDAHFAAAPAAGAGQRTGTQPIQAAGIESATIDGNVVLMQQEPAKPGEAAEEPLRATAGHAVYEGGGEWLHLTEQPRIEDAGLQMTAEKVDVSQASGSAFAHGNVKATWTGTGKQSAGAPGGMGLGGDGPSHVVAAEAELHRPGTGLGGSAASPAEVVATFKGQARLWQGANSVAAPVIVLDRARETLVAQGNGAAEPVNLVLLNANGGEGKRSAGKPATPSVVRVRADDLKYSGAERKAVLRAGAGERVVAETAGATVSSNEAEVALLPPGNHAGPEGRAAEVDRMTARGNVVVKSQGRRGTGEKLVYTSESGEYVLTGTSTTPPRMVDPIRGTVTGEALIFNTLDDSVSIEGQGQKTSTQTVAPR